MDMPMQQMPQPQMQPPQANPQAGPNMQATMQSLGAGPMGSGLANNAAMLTQYREPYMQMATQMAMEGQEPPPFEQWVQSQMPQDALSEAAPAAPEGRRGMITRLINSLKGS